MTDTPTNLALLQLIRGAETEHGYDDYSRYATLTPPKAPTQMTVREVQEWQRKAARAGSKSVAIGGYQMITKTFNGVVEEMALTGDEMFDAAMQDRMGMHLLNRRGYRKWASGQMSDSHFADNLSMEWAALPRFTGPKRGRSHYDKDGLNASRVAIDVVQQAMNASRDGTPFDFGATAKAGMPAARGGVASAQDERALMLSELDPSTTYNGADLEGVNKPTARYRSKQDEKDAAVAPHWTPTFWEGAEMAMDEGFISSSVLRQMNREEFEPPTSSSPKTSGHKPLRVSLKTTRWLCQRRRQKHTLRRCRRKSNGPT
ncbi:hypothetical protein SAMN04488030_1960 [Aliiroseovarius halocynthiae]|nr:hypothetical protein SAMN04488030_1960 [Aliiroseovarius halocynthiae]